MALGIRVWYITQKEGLLSDESHSYIISLRNEVGFTRPMEEIIFPDSYEIKNKFDCRSGYFRGYHIGKD